MRYILVIFFIFLFSFTVISCSKKDDSSSSTSANGSPGTYQLATNDYANGVATDSSGNVYVTGGTKGGLDGNTSAGNTDLFVVKYSSSGTKQWTKQLGSSGLDSANGITIDSSGNVYVTGVTFGGLDWNTSAGANDLFVVKYNSSGTKQWTEQLGSASSDFANGVATDSSGNVYVVGVTYGGLDGNSNEDNSDLFVVKYNSSGTKQWTKQYGTDRYDEARGVATDSSGNVYVVGGTKGNLNGISNSGRTDAFVIKFNSSDTKQWTKKLGTWQNDLANGVATDSSGNFYVTGFTYQDMDGNTSAGNADFFVVKYNSSGTKQWTEQLGTPSSDAANAVATDSSGNVYVAGVTYGVLGDQNKGNSDLFVVKYNSSGTKQWVEKQNGTEQNGTDMWDEARGVVTDSSGNVYVVGGTKGSKLNGVSKAGMTEAFVIKYNSSGKRQWTKLLGTWRKDFANAVAIDSSGNIYVAGVTERDLEDEPRKDFAGKDDLFVVKYDSKGKKQWTKQLGTKRNDRATGVATDSSGNIYVTGYTYWGLDGNTNAGSNDAFLVKYLDNGTKQWTKQFGTSSTDLADGVATDSSGNVYLVGYTYGGLDGNTNTGASDLFVVKYNSSGTKQWTKQMGSSSRDYDYGVATDSSRNVYVSGGTYGGLDGNTSAGNADLFVVKYNSSGTKQ